MQLIADQSLGRVVGNVKSNTTRWVNNYLGREGSIWQQGFHDRALRKDEDVIEVARYVIANPVHDVIVNQVGDYALWDAKWV